MAPTSGNYTFFLTGSSSVTLYFSNTRRDNAKILLTISYEKDTLKRDEWNREPGNQTSSPQFLNGCSFCFLKILAKGGDMSENHAALGIQYPSGEIQKPVNNKNLFWVKPGEFTVDFSLSENIPDIVEIGTPFSVEGFFNTDCVGLYCGDCPAAFFLVFENYVECASSHAKRGSLLLNLKKNWFTSVGFHPIKMGFQRNGNCSLLADVKFMRSQSNVELSKVGQIKVKPVFLLTCAFNISNLCDKDVVSITGWRIIETRTNVPSYGLASTKANTLAELVIRMTKIIGVSRYTGVCVNFLYKITGVDNTLTVSLSNTLSTTPNKVWHLAGDFGALWRQGSFCITNPQDNFQLRFQSKVSLTNATVVIAAVNLTSEACLTKPSYAEPGYKCPLNTESCKNGQCIEKKLFCNGDSDCIDGSDEDCECQVEQYKCKTSGVCISIRKICDDVIDCSDGDDESDCNYSCEDNFRCPDGECVEWSKTCDGDWDCQDGADEPEICGYSKCTLDDLACRHTNQTENNQTICYTDASCDFGNGLCTWRNLQSPMDDFDWSLNSGPTLTSGTGPFTDHTTKSEKGRYLFIEASHPRRLNDKALLISGINPGGKHVCFTFYYHMFGKDVGSLLVFVSKNSFSKDPDIMLDKIRANMTVVYSKNHSSQNIWRRAEMDISVQEDYWILIGGVRGSGSLGDIAIDDILISQQNCSELDTALFSRSCSFESSKKCSWELNSTGWVRSRLRMSLSPISPILQDKCLRTQKPSSLKTTIPNTMAGRYRCLTFWYKATPCQGEEKIQIIQIIGGTRSSYEITLSREGVQWTYTDVPLQASSQEYLINIIVDMKRRTSRNCVINIDEINLITELCPSFLQDQMVWKRKDSVFYLGMVKKLNTTHSVIAYLNPETPSDFFQVLSPPDQVNIVVNDSIPINKSDVVLGARVLVEIEPNRSVAGILINKTLSHSWQKIQLTIRKEWNGEELFVTTENIRLLQYQLDTPGPPNDYEYCFRLSGFCYYLPNPLTWFDAVDHCKMYGGYMYNFGLKPGRNSSLKPPRYASVWIALHGHKSNGLSFSWIDGSNYSYTKNDTNLEKRGGLCVAMENNILSRKNCSERFIALCRKTAEIHVIIGATDYNKTLTCRDPNEVLSIESAFLYPEVDSEGCDKSYKKKCEKESPNVEADVKKMCHGKRFCSLSIVQFLESKNLVNKTDLNIVFKCNLSLNDSVSCDLGSPWCGWLVFKSNDSLAGWQRENIHKSNGTLEIDTVAHLNKSWENMDVYLSLKQNSSLQWFFKRAFSDLTNPISDLTLCLWLFPFKNTTNATVVSFEDYFKIFIDDNCTFWFIKSHTRSSTNTTVTLETWQHICVSISKEKTWRFYKNGEMFASGETQFTYSPSILINIYSCKAFPDQCMLGMFTKPNMWLKSLQQEEIAMVSRACGIRFPSIQELWEGKRGRKVINKNAFCIPGIKDYRITHRSRESSYNTSSTLISPWITRDTTSPVCAVFLYHMLGVHVGIELSVQQPSMKEEVVWKVENSENSMMWKYGQVYIGLVLRFRIIFHSKVSALGGAVSVDNIFFKDGFCKSIPKQEWLIENPSGYITSPRYPLYYENNMKRQWEIQAATGQRIRLYFEYFNLEDSVQCKSDFLDIFDGLNHDRFCGSNRPLDYTSVSNYLLITFQSNHQLIKTGFKIRHRIIKENPSENVCSSDVLDCPDAVYCFPLSNNKNKIHISSDDSLLDIPSTVPKNTVSMFFDLSKVVRFEYESFKNLSELEWLSLRQSSLAVIEDNAFDDLTDLKFLYLSDNHLRNIPTNLFKNTRELQTIDFGSNKLVSLPSNLFSSHNNMRVLSFVHNRIGALEGYFFSRLNKLEYLYLNNNELKLIKSKAFSGLFKLKVLKLHRNLLTEVEPGAFDDLIELTQLDLSFNHIQDIPDGLFKSLKSLQKVKLDHFLLCCHAKEAKSSVSCTSIHNNGFSSCDELLKNKVLQYAMWILGVMAFVGNLVVIIWRLMAKDKNRVNSFLLTNLAVADFLMGIYMMIIAYKNYAWRGIYFKHDTSWRSSNTCVFAGIISTVSSEVSVMMLCVITLDRVICIIFPFRLRRLSLKKASVFVVIIWLLGLAISFAPLMQDSYFHDFTNQVHFYGRSPVCLPLQLSNDLHPGWEFSVTVFIGFNGMSFLFILISYVVMYRHIIKTASAVRSTRMNQDSTLAKRMMFIILTDFLCWFPVIIMSILGLSGYLHDPNKDVYAWIAVFVLPINSSINPILYTFSTPFVRQKIFSTRNKTKATNSKEFRTDKAASYRFNTEFANIDDTRADTLSPERDLEQSMPDVHYCETSLVKTTKDKYCLSVYETFDLFVTGGNIKHSLKAEVDEDEKLCLVHIYSDKKEWQNMTEFMSWLSNESGHTGILAFSWSSPATDVAIEQAPECLSNDLSIKDSFFICYLFPGEDTLQDLFTDKVVFSAQEICSVSKSLIQALHYLQSKQIIHNAVIASNIVITKQDEDSWLTTVLGGFHHAQFWNQSEDDNEIQQNAAFKNDMISYGKIIKILLQNCHESEQLQTHHRVVDLCLNDDKELVPNAYDVLSLIGGIDDMTIEI